MANYMKKVAQMLGVELDEEFNVDCSHVPYKITKDGMFYWSEEQYRWQSIDSWLTEILSGKIKIIKKPILDDDEREYLSNVIKPFRDKVTGIIKWGKEIGKGLEYIVVIYTDDCKERGMGFPCFKEGTMYKGMEPNKEYTLEELGL